MPRDPLIVLKFGGSVLLDEQRLRVAVHEIYRWRRDGWSVVAVVSALAGATDALLARCARLHDRPAPLAEAALVATGELQSAALLGLHLDRAGVPARVLSPAGIGLVADGDPLDADPRSLETRPLRRALRRDGVVVVPGYVAVDRRGRTVLLGRGGSDLTALFLAHRLGATRCRLVKDVDGLYERDPAGPGPSPDRYLDATWDDALATDGSIVQHKAIRFAREHGVAFELGGANATAPTRIGPGPTRTAVPPAPGRPLRVALLGRGTVGGGVRELIGQMPERFDVAGIAVRDPSRRGPDPATAPLTTDAVALAGSGVDIVVEAMGGTATALAAARAALRTGSHLVTANKALLADHGPELRRLAARFGGSVRGSATVGGSVPLLERLRSRSAAPVRSVRAVLNGTTNYVLERCAAGIGLDEAVAEAQALGFAEADPSRDLDGTDAADKLRVMADTIGAGPVRAGQVAREALDASAGGRLAGAGPVRHVASLERGGAAWRAAVRPCRVADDDPLAAVAGEHNAAVIERDDGTVEVVRGRGAGRWPTSEAVVADLLEIARMGRATDRRRRAGRGAAGFLHRPLVRPER
ncbi:MAG: homoserine dehydrogenase [Planctomycetota bacterium]|jgi:homoserine dehydrogenase